MRTRTKRRRKKNRLARVVTILIILTVIFTGITKILSKSEFLPKGSEIEKFNIQNLDSKELHSKNAILVDYDRGKVLLSKNGDTKCYPASLVKIMTALVAIENVEYLDKRVTIGEDIFNLIKNQNASVVGYEIGETTTVNDLLYGSILSSGADASLELAIATSGSISEFVKLMNKKAQELKMSGTNYTNPTGLHDVKQVTTVEDVSKLLRYALNNSEFKKVFESKTHIIKTDKRKFSVYSTYFSKTENDNQDYEVLGAKTGTTNEAGSCLASYTYKKHNKFILVTTKAPIVKDKQPNCFDDLSYVFSNI